MTKNGYREIELCCGTTIERAVWELQECNKRGEKVFVNFNETELYSDEVPTVDSAYLKILGQTKAEFDLEQKKEREERLRKEREFKAKIPELTKEWVKKGHEVLDEKYWAHWDTIVPIRLSDLYQGWELGMCLDIIRVLNKGPDYMIEAKDVLNDQGHSGMSYYLVRRMVYELHDLGEEFFNYTKI